MVPQTIAAGFRATVVSPLNRRAIKIPGNNPLTNTPTAVLAQRGGIQYMPFLSRSEGRSVDDMRRPLSRELRYSPIAEDVSDFEIDDSMWPECEGCEKQGMYLLCKCACLYVVRLNH
jgi:hypothetical protein